MYLQSEREFEHLVDDINAGRPQCPVGLMTLVLPRKGTLGVNDKQPFVYLKCGHVHGQHQWGQSHDSNDGRTCPLCLTVSLTFYLQVLSADNLCKQFGFKIRPNLWSGLIWIQTV